MSAEPVNPPRPPEERAKLAVVWVALGLGAVVVAATDLPYDLGGPNPLLAKGEIVDHILAAKRANNGRWPASEDDPSFSFGPRAAAEATPATFSLFGIEKLRKEERATYNLRFRSAAHKLVVTFDPNAKPRRKKF